MWKPRKRHRLTRQELYDLVWSDPVYKVAARYGISGTGLAKICRNASIPLPERGYWSRVQAGQTVKRYPLRPAKTAENESVVILQGDGPRPKPPPRPALERPIAKAIENEKLDKNRILVSEQIARLHPEVKKIAEAWAVRKSSWNNRNPRPEPLELRRRRILHAFFRAVEDRGGTVSAKPYDTGFTVTLFGSEFALSCDEPERRVRVPLTREELKNRSEWDKRDYKTVSERTGVLRMRVIWDSSRHKDFLEKDDAPLESRLNDVMGYLLENSITVAERDRRADAARKAAAEAEALRAKAELQQLKAEEVRRREEERINALIERAERWNKACRIRAFVDAASSVTGYAEESWIAWARSVADRLDPIASNEDPDPPRCRGWWEEDDD